MKQGTGNKTSAPKGPSRVSAVSLGTLSHMGCESSNLKRPGPLFKKTGIEAPKAAVTQHHCGSQGKHK